MLDFVQTRCVRVNVLGLHFLACASESSKSFCHVERTVKLSADPVHKYDTHQVLMFGSGVMRSRECVDDRDEAFLPQLLTTVSHMPRARIKTLQSNSRAEKGAMGARSFVEERVLSVCTRSNPAPEAGIDYTTPQVEGSP